MTPQRALEDFSFLEDRARRKDIWDRYKFIPLSPSRRSFLTLGLEYRTEYEWYNNALWGAGPQDAGGYSLQRVIPLLDAHINKHVRWFNELQYEEVLGRNGGPRPGIDADRGDVHQSFLELGQTLHPRQGLSLRTGRQEVVLGSGRLVDNNEGVNVKSSFDGFRLSCDERSWRLTSFALRPTELNRGAFDDSPDHRRSFWGVYATLPLTHTPGKIDLYYLGYANKQAQFERGAGKELRSSVGVRVFRTEDGAPAENGWSYNWEAVWQWGHLNSDRLRAWTLATDTGYHWTALKYKPHLALRADVASGDHNPAVSKTFSTFNPLFPRGAYFAPKMVLAGPYNFYDLRPLLQFSLRRNLTGQLDASWFWRESIHDGIYSPGGQLLRPGNLSRAHYVGAQGDLEIRQALDAHLTLAYNFAGFLTGAFLRQTPPGASVVSVNIGLTYKF